MISGVKQGEKTSCSTKPCREGKFYERGKKMILYAAKNRAFADVSKPMSSGAVRPFFPEIKVAAVLLRSDCIPAGEKRRL